MKQPIYVVIYDPTFPGVNRLYLNDSNQWVQCFNDAATFYDGESASTARDAQIRTIKNNPNPTIKNNIASIKARIFIKDVAVESF
ncbi:MAG: hypothetical protein KME47_09890 [Nodosilinea sp. WJT8-NPBG4]|jgi:hypothetical protein|nr:hypothetical protein [Nodosilinea sp. WJT8-NPBG4]